MSYDPDDIAELFKFMRKRNGAGERLIQHLRAEPPPLPPEFKGPNGSLEAHHVQLALGHQRGVKDTLDAIMNLANTPTKPVVEEETVRLKDTRRL